MNTIPAPAVISTLANLGAAFTPETIEVYCDWADKPAFTNFDGARHFCQFCGSTDHETLS